jgi:hypothetical protein
MLCVLLKERHEWFFISQYRRIEKILFIHKVFRPFIYLFHIKNGASQNARITKCPIKSMLDKLMEYFQTFFYNPSYHSPGAIA